MLVDWQIQRYLRFIAKGAFLEARIFYTMALIENSRKAKRGIRP